MGSLRERYLDRVSDAVAEVMVTKLMWLYACDRAEAVRRFCGGEWIGDADFTIEDVGYWGFR